MHPLGRTSGTSARSPSRDAASDCRIDLGGDHNEVTGSRRSAGVEVNRDTDEADQIDVRMRGGERPVFAAGMIATQVGAIERDDKRDLIRVGVNVVGSARRSRRRPSDRWMDVRSSDR